MITLPLKEKLLGLNGKPLTSEGQDVTLGVALANIVLAPHKDKKGFRPLKALELALKMNSDKTIDLDSSDLIQIKEILDGEGHGQLPIVIARIQNIINEVDKPKAKK